MVFPVVTYQYESWTLKKAECWRTDAFKLWCWRRLFKVPWAARRSKQSILKEIKPEYSLEGLMLKLKLQLIWLPDAKSQLIGKRPWSWERLRARGEEAIEVEMVGRHHPLSGHESEQAPQATGKTGMLQYIGSQSQTWLSEHKQI